MNAERTEKWLRQLEHLRGHLWHRYSIAVNIIKLGNYHNITGWGLAIYRLGSTFDINLCLLNNSVCFLLKPTPYITCDVECWHIKNSSSSVAHGWSHSYARYLIEIPSYSWIFHLESDWSRCVWKTGVAWTWYLICVINKKHFFLLYLFACNLPTYRKIWVILCCYSNFYRPDEDQ